MDNEPLQLVVAVFAEEDAADRALGDLKQAQKARIVQIDSAAVVRRLEDGTLQIKEESDPGGRRGALAGGVMGAVIGLLGGPGGAIVAGAAGAVIGGVTARVIDTGIPDNDLRLIAQSLLPGDSAVVAIVDDPWMSQAQRLLVESGARVLTGTLTRVIAAQLELPPDADPEPE